MSSFKNSPSLSHQNIRIITRLRGSQNIEKNEFERQETYKIKNINQNKKYERSKSPNLKKEIKGLNPSIKYTMFTCKQPSNTLIISSKPIKGSSINETLGLMKLVVSAV